MIFVAGPCRGRGQERRWQVWPEAASWEHNLTVG